MTTNLKITVFLEKLGKTEEEQVRELAEFLRTLADEMEDHKRIGTGSNPCFKSDGSGPIAEFHTEQPA